MPGGSVSLSVQAHPARIDYLAELVGWLDPGGAQLPVAIDEGAGQWETARKAWTVGLSTGAAHHVVLQDDALPCADFGERLSRTCDNPDRAYSLYFGREIGSLTRHAAAEARNGRSWIDLREMYWGVAIALPVRIIQAMLLWTRDFPVPKGWEGRRSDSRIGRFLSFHDIPVRYPIPSLVDHRTGPSLFGAYKHLKPTDRVAWWFADNPRPQ